MGTKCFLHLSKKVSVMNTPRSGHTHAHSLKGLLKHTFTVTQSTASVHLLLMHAHALLSLCRTTVRLDYRTDFVCYFVCLCLK